MEADEADALGSADADMHALEQRRRLMRRRQIARVRRLIAGTGVTGDRVIIGMIDLVVDVLESLNNET